MLQAALVERFQLQYSAKTKERQRSRLNLKDSKNQDDYPWGGSVASGLPSSGSIAGDQREHDQSDRAYQADPGAGHRIRRRGAQIWARIALAHFTIPNRFHRLQLAKGMHNRKARIKMVKTWMKCGAPLFLVLAGAALAQDTAPLKLTLKDAVGLALKQNPQVILANLQVSQSEQDRLLARSGLMPQVNGSMSEAVNRVNLQASIGLTIPGFAQHVGPFEVFEMGASVNAPVFDLTLWRRYKSSKLGIDASRAEETTVREESVMLVVSQYLGCQRASADVSAAQSRVELAQAVYDQSADLQKNGVGTGIDTLRANVELQNEKQRLIVSQTELQTSLYGLARLLNVDPHRPIEIGDQVSFFDTPATSVNETVEKAYDTRPELKALHRQQERAALEARTAGDQRLPKVMFSGFWAEQGLTPSTVIPVYQYQGTILVPIFTGGRISADRAKADLAIRQLQQQEVELRNRIALEVKTAAAQVESARNEVGVANSGVQLALEEVTQARDRFQAGVANNLEVITAQNELARANDNQIGALYRYNQARASMAYAEGQMEAMYAR
jgi:outer membrane protein TolC